ncbi:hypothetical protein DICSQDRAFT_165404 [Dichomitus squalens LYAD-421 SS1]|uniref:Uncharacterized protein n=1 Tax=Dichomitus squalens TaxID=114155 RepID=A0A4Q9QE82_9APHY|nr:uncharacterized protein DICSQDRAFT_165404 [Dichomitus squalens LYAD-421 SS1]EJF65693.1 hypothetical protein DICSQDRAFT_165404 [Dichomitus squalens LYAD-421 SS1]TBU66025.1 hypothetical protein BD310DRAFT_803609 [Dichomitus squalens]
MGSASSKPAARKLARTPPAWVGARTPNPNVGEQLHPHARPLPRASETKDEGIQRDAHDPQFLANLSKLGPVRVDHHMQTIRPAAASAQRIHDTRLRSEEEARSPRSTRNRLVAESLLELLEERKYVATQKDLEALAKKFDMDLDKLERLARHVNSVSVNQETVKRWVGEDGSGMGQPKNKDRATNAGFQPLTFWFDPDHLQNDDTTPHSHKFPSGTRISTS